jgi:hypothetical protein
VAIDREPSETSSDVAGAMDRVLEAEQQTLRAISESERRAEQMLEQARETARRIGARTDRRLGAIHAACAARRKRLLESDEGATPSSVDLDDEKIQRLRGAAEELAERLSCG